jgi:hypothetical protein
MWSPKLIYFMHPYCNCRGFLAFKSGCEAGQAAVSRSHGHKLLQGIENSQFRHFGHVYRRENKFMVGAWIDEN